MSQMPNIELKRLQLRLLVPEDAFTFKRLLQDPEIAAMGLGVRYPYQEGDAEAIIEHAQNGREKLHFTWGIVLRQTGELIGLITLIINSDHHFGEIGYWIGKDYWNQGYATEATCGIIQQGFEHYHLNKVFARTFHNNPASVRVLEKADMTYEGTMRQHMWHPLSAEYKDLLVFSILRSEYEKDPT